MVFNTGPYTDLPDNSILITANMQSETGFPSSHQLKSYVASKSRLKLAARAVVSADAGLLVDTTTDTVTELANIKREGNILQDALVPSYMSHFYSEDWFSCDQVILLNVFRMFLV